MKNAVIQKQICCQIKHTHDYCFTELTIECHKKNFYVYGCGVNQEVYKLYNILARNPDKVVIADIFKVDGNDYLVGKIEVIRNRGTKRSLYGFTLKRELVECNGFREIRLVSELPQNVGDK